LRRVSFLSAMLFTAVLCLSGIGVAATEPPELQKNQILVVAECPPPDGPSYTFVINGMSKTGDVEESTGNVVVKQYIVEYREFPSGKFIERDEYVNPVTEPGKKKGFKGDLIQCTGETEEPIELEGLGTVTAIYDFQAFVTPRGGA
jgi:hypothetical protein